MARTSTVIIIVLLVIIIIGGGCAVLFGMGILKFGSTQAVTPSGGGTGLVIDENAGVYVAPTAAPQKPGIAIPGWGTITIPANTKDVTVDFYNPGANDGNYYLTFELRLADGEVLYKSNLVKPGLHIQKITLSRGLPAGTYDASVFVQPYTMDEAMTAVNNANMKTTLIVR